MQRGQRGKRLILAAVLGIAVIAVMVFALVIAGSSSDTRDPRTKQAADLSAPDTEPLGVAFSPVSFTADGITDFYEQAGQREYSVSWHGDWAELAVSNGAPHQLMRAASQYGFTPIILVGTHTQIQGKPQAIRPLDDTTAANYKRWAVDFARRYEPVFFGMGNEVNLLDPAGADFERLEELFNETAIAVKKVSPTTRTFVTFQLERLKGMNGGLFGGQNEPERARWGLLQSFNADIIAFTTYPGLIYHDPDDVPKDYYDEILNRTNKPIAFSEVGWAAEPMAAGWQSDSGTQAHFVTRFLDDIKNLSSDFTVWLMLYDQKGTGVFESMGLYDSQGAARPALGLWSAPRQGD